ncbi:MAG: HPP family protein [Syntrophales bacterium]|nr:HPP family protein [Syntrophales bacterium]
MPGPFRFFEGGFRSHWLSYVMQAALATASVFVVFTALRQQHLVVAASLAATAFTVFAMPRNITASTRNVVGGHLLGLIFGSIFAFFPHEIPLVQDATYALAVGAAIFVMTLTKTAHPPAAGTALGVVISGPSFQVVLGVVLGVTLLTLMHNLLKPMLRDLVTLPGRLR